MTPEPKDPTAMPFLQHLEELRQTVIQILLAVGIGAVLCWVFSRRVLDWLIQETSGEAIFMKPQGAFLAQLKVALVLGLLLTLPFVFYRVWSFVGPGLLQRERRIVLPGALTSVVLFYAGLAFSFFILTPVMVEVLLGFGSAHLTANTEVHFLLDLVFMMGLASGLIFQLPLFAAFLSGIGVIRARQLKIYWRHAVVAMFITAALLTPADPLSQLILAVPLLLLYGVSYLVALFVERARKKDTASESQGRKSDAAGR